MSSLRVPAVCAFMVFGSARALAQGVETRLDTANARAGVIVVGSLREDRARAAELHGAPIASHALMRSASSSVRDSGTARFRELRWGWMRPTIDLVWNSGGAFSLNDGAPWAGRGLTMALSGGVRATARGLHVVMMPQIWTTANDQFAVLPGRDSLRSSFGSPWYSGLISADLPERFGVDRTTAFDLGESAAWWRTSRVDVGIATESQWWGPGIRNALLMSNNAGGIPHAFLRTSAPVRTAAGDIEAKWIVGALSESRFFDANSANDMRSLSGGVVTFTPRPEPGLTVGMARVVYAVIPGAGALPARALDVIGRWGRGLNVRSATHGRAAEQLMSVFGRWVFPGSGAEAYGEWGRIMLPTTLRSLLVAPQASQGFTAGMQWAPAIGPSSRLRLQAEVTNLEQSPPSRSADTISFYVSSVVPQGYTHRGQVVGAAIGPGASSQWLAIDYMRDDRSAGVFAGRIRWNTDAYYTQPTSIVYLSYDASVFAGARVAGQLYGRELAAELWWQKRHNYLFQNQDYGYSREGTFDKRVITAKLRVY